VLDLARELWYRDPILLEQVPPLAIWHYWLWSFKTRDTKLERFLHKNQHTQRKLLNFENWTNGEPRQLAKIRVFEVDHFYFSCKKLKN
jgi:hypothetical protein